MKKSISIVLVLSIIASFFAMCGVTAFAENDIMDYFTYEIVDDEVTITDCDESISGDVVIPDTIEGYPVVQLGEFCFSDCTEITSVTLPEGLETIDYDVFVNCSKLTDIKFCSTLTYIGPGAFENCTSLEKVVVPDNVTLGYNVFKNCTSLTEAEIGTNNSGASSAFQDCINLETVKINSAEIDGTFNGCISLKNVEFGDNVKMINSSSFGYCVSLEEIYITENISEIELESFNACISLKKIDVDENNPVYASENGLLLNKDKTKLMLVPIGIRNSFVIPETVTTIGMQSYYLFIEAEIDLTGIEVVETAAYVYCFDQEELVIPESVNHINSMAFLSCNFLKDVYIYNPDVQLDEMCFGFSDFEVIAEKDAFVEIAKKTVYAYDEAESEYWYEKFENSLIFKDGFEPSAILTIHGYAGSTAETYANENGFKFVPICRHNYVDTVITAPTYTKAGIGGMVCDGCGDVQRTYEIPVYEIDDGNEEKDEETGVSVIFPDGTFDDDAEIEITPVEEGEAYKLISHKEGNFKVTMFDINVTVDNQKVQPNGAVLVQIPLPKGYNQNKCIVYYIADDGTMEELTTYHFKDGYVYFETDHFSYYAILEEVEETSDATDNNSNDFMSYLRSLLNKFIDAFMRFIDMIKSIFGLE